MIDEELKLLCIGDGVCVLIDCVLYGGVCVGKVCVDVCYGCGYCIKCGEVGMV